MLEKIRIVCITVIFTITISFLLVAVTSLSKQDCNCQRLEQENAHLKEELKKANSDTSHKHCIRNYKPI